MQYAYLLNACVSILLYYVLFAPMFDIDKMEHDSLTVQKIVGKQCFFFPGKYLFM